MRAAQYWLDSDTSWGERTRLQSCFSQRLSPARRLGFWLPRTTCCFSSSCSPRQPGSFCTWPMSRLAFWPSSVPSALHSQPIFKVEAGKAAEVVPALHGGLSVSECAALDWREAQWCEHSVERQAACASAPRRLSSVDDVVLLHRDLVASLSSRDRTGFLDRLERARFKPAAIVFEALFLLSWQLFLVWPWLRRLSRRRKAFHVLVSPLLLFVPFYLGYAPLTFTFGPSGGFLYPLYLLIVGLPLEFLPSTPVDQALLRSAPCGLSFLSHLLGPPVSGDEKARKSGEGRRDTPDATKDCSLG